MFCGASVTLRIITITGAVMGYHPVIECFMLADRRTYLQLGRTVVFAPTSMTF